MFRYHLDAGLLSVDTSFRNRIPNDFEEFFVHLDDTFVFDDDGEDRRGELVNDDTTRDNNEICCQCSIFWKNFDMLVEIAFQFFMFARCWRILEE